MISTYDLEKRVYEFFDAIFYGDQVQFGFSSASSACFFSTKLTNAPRVAASSILFYTIKEVTSFGNTFSDYSEIDRFDGKEKVYTWRKVPVEVCIMSKVKGAAKTAMSYIIALQPTTRHDKACYDTGDFDLALHEIDTNMRDLSFLENGAWNERIDADFTFNYKDTIILGDNQPFIEAPSSVYLTKDKIDFDIDLKGGK